MIFFDRETYAACGDEIAAHAEAHFHEIFPKEGMVQMDDSRYLTLENNNALVVITARNEIGELVGYITAIVYDDLHQFGALLATADFYYLAPKARSGFAGIHLIKAMETELSAIGVKKFYIAATSHMKTAKMLQYIKYNEEEIIYSKLLGGATE